MYVFEMDAFQDYEVSGYLKKKSQIWFFFVRSKS